MKKSRICWIRILFPVFAVLLFSVFLLTIKVNASSGENVSYFPIPQNYNNIAPASVISYVNNTFDSDNNYYLSLVTYNSDGYFVLNLVYFPKTQGTICGEINNAGTHFALYTVGDPIPQFRRIELYPDGSFRNATYISIDWFQNCPSSLYDNSIAYISNYTVYTSNSDNKSIVINYVPKHHEPKPPQPEDPEYDSGDSAPIQVPFDNNVSNDTGFLGKTLQYFGNLINDNLNEFKNNLFDNLLPFISIFSDLYNLGLDENGGFSVGGVFTSLLVPSSQQFIQAVIEHDDFDFIGTSKVVLTDAPRILSQLYNVTSTPVFHVTSCTFHGVEIGNFDISFAWFAPYKVYYDVIVSTFLVIAYIYWIFISMHGHIRTTYTPGPQEEEYWRY